MCVFLKSLDRFLLVKLIVLSNKSAAVLNRLTVVSYTEKVDTVFTILLQCYSCYSSFYPSSFLISKNDRPSHMLQTIIW